MMPLSKSDFSISDACSVYEMAGGSGQSTYSRFCPNCGSPLTRNSERMSDRIYVHAASLDDPGLYRPEKSLYANAAQDWDKSAIIKED